MSMSDENLAPTRVALRQTCLRVAELAGKIVERIDLRSFESGPHPDDHEGLAAAMANYATVAFVLATRLDAYAYPPTVAP